MWNTRVYHGIHVYYTYIIRPVFTGMLQLFDILISYSNDTIISAISSTYNNNNMFNFLSAYSIARKRFTYLLKIHMIKMIKYIKITESHYT